MSRRRYSFTPQERDLLRTALEVWRLALNPSSDGGYVTPRQRAAGEFTQRRIDEMLARLQENAPEAEADE